MSVERWLSVVRLRWRSLTRARELDLDLEDELRDHVEARVGEHIAAGVEPAAARRRALAELGGLTQVTERCRDTRGLALVESLVQDVRYGARALVRDLGFTSIAILTLALGVGANLAVFTLVDGILLSPLPFPAPERLVSVTGTYPQGGFAALRREAQSFDAAAYVEGQPLVLKGGGAPVQVLGARVSAEFFHVLDAAPALGRTFAPPKTLHARMAWSSSATGSGSSSCEATPASSTASSRSTGFRVKSWASCRRPSDSRPRGPRSGFRSASTKARRRATGAGTSCR